MAADIARSNARANSEVHGEVPAISVCPFTKTGAGAIGLAAARTGAGEDVVLARTAEADSGGLSGGSKPVAAAPIRPIKAARAWRARQRLASLKA
jgi:hypothetical protein